MVSKIFSLLAIPAALLPLVAARTDLTGCTRTDVSSPAGASYAWYVPGTGETCDFLDCGGGLAPPKYDVPGCPQYTGTAAYSPSYLPGYTAPATQAAAASTAAASTAMASATASPSSYDDGDDEDDCADGACDDEDYDDEDDCADGACDDEGYDDGEDDSDDYDSDDDDDDYTTDDATVVWRTADNPTATFHPYDVSTPWPTGVSTYYIPVEVETGSTTWEAVAVTVDSSGWTNLVPVSTPASSELPAICAFATNSGCGMTTSYISVPAHTAASASATATSDSGSSSSMASGSKATASGSKASSSLTKSFVDTRPETTRNANDVSVANETSSVAAASSTPSQGAAAGLSRTFGVMGFLTVALAAVFAL